MGFKLQPSTIRLYKQAGVFDDATATATLSGGTVYAITMTNKGSGYISATDATVAFTAAPGGGTNAEGTAILGEGKVTFVPVNAAGAGYVTPPAVTFSGGGGSGALGVGIIGPYGTIVGVRLLNTGTGYTSVPTAAIAAAPTGGTNATLNTVQCSFRITGVTITNAGVGYLVAPTPTFGTPRQAIVTCELSQLQAMLAPITTDPRAVATGESLFVVSPIADTDGNYPLPREGVTSSRSVVLQRLKTTGSYSVALGYQLAAFGY